MLYLLKCNVLYKHFDKKNPQYTIVHIYQLLLVDHLGILREESYNIQRISEIKLPQRHSQLFPQDIVMIAKQDRYVKY